MAHVTTEENFSISHATKIAIDVGLSVCCKFINLCDGDIDFHSVHGHGSEIFFTLPDQKEG